MAQTHWGKIDVTLLLQSGLSVHLTPEHFVYKGCKGENSE